MVKYLHYLALVSMVPGLLIGCKLSYVTKPPPKSKYLQTPTKTLAPTTAADELGKLLNDMRSMQATFTQTTTNQQGKTIGRKISGKLMLFRPGKFRWEIIKPNQQLIIVNQNKSLLYDADLEQLTKQKVNYNQPGNPAMLLSGSLASLKKSFTITRLNKNRFALTPKNKKSAFQKTTLQFVKGQLKTMEIVDNLFQKNLIIFNNIKFNLKISEKMFKFNPPANTEIFDANQT